MGWAARTKTKRKFSDAERRGIRLVACVNCGEYTGTLRRAFTKGGRTFYIHDLTGRVLHPMNRACYIRFVERENVESTIKRLKEREAHESVG